MTRTALLVRCDAGEANRIRIEAYREHRTISGYVLRISLNAVAADARLSSQFPDYRSRILLRRRVQDGSPVEAGERTAILVRCDVDEAEQIREAARLRDIRINAFVLQALKISWNQQMPPPTAVKAPLAVAPQ